MSHEPATLLALACVLAGCGSGTGLSPEVGWDAGLDAGTADAAAALDASAPDASVDAGSAPPPCALHLAASGSLEVASLVVDRDSNVLLAGSFEGSFDSGSDVLTSAGGHDAFVASFGPRCEPRWAIRLGGIQNDHGSSLAVDDAGNPTLCASFSDTIRVGDETIASLGTADVLVVQLDPAGSVRWFHSFGTKAYDQPCAVAAGADGTVGITGAALPGLDLGDPPAANATSTDVLVAAYSSEGAPLFWRRFPQDQPDLEEGDYDTGLSVVVRDDVLYATGWIRSAVDFGGGPLVAEGWSDVVLCAFTTDGAHLWSRRFGSDEQWGDMPVALAADRDGHLFLTGTFWNEIDLGDGALVNDDGPLPARATFLASFGADGSPRWSTRIDAQTNIASSALAVGDDGGLFLTGVSAGDINVDGTTRLEDWPVWLRPFAMAFDPDGSFAWSSFVGTSPAASAHAHGIGVSSEGVVYAAGSFERTLDVGLGEWTAEGERDGFLTVLEPP